MNMRQVVNGLLLRNDDVLMAHRSADRSSYPDTWSFPGGHVEPGETLEEALVRELTEEISVLPTSWRKLDGFRYVHNGSKFHFFAVGEWQGRPTNLGREHIEIRWVHLATAHNMPKLTFPIYEKIFSELAKT